MIAIVLQIRGGLSRCKGGKSALSVRAALRCRTSRKIASKRCGGHPQPARLRYHHGYRVSTGPVPLGASWRSLAGWADSYLLPLRSLQSTDHTHGAADGVEVPTREQHHEVFDEKKMVNSSLSRICGKALRFTVAKGVVGCNVINCPCANREYFLGAGLGAARKVRMAPSLM